MIKQTLTPAFPSDDKRWRIVETAMKRSNYQADALIETLHAVQEAFGFVDESAMQFVSARLNLPASKVYGVATFYNLFQMKPAGEHTLSVCTGTACHVKGNDQIVEFLREEYGLNPGDTTPDGKLSFIGARCVGACGLAPVLIFDGKIVGKLSVDEMKQKIREWVNDES
ncbi:MAG: bidirectional hydrogenase complex protein HoxE [Anaerolineae bacterium]|nr:bidirectional hydrogenase complex protein HoxE [Anaerolineae bacterium]